MFYYICVSLLFFLSISTAASKSSQLGIRNEKKAIENICVVKEVEKQMKVFNFSAISNQNISDYEIKIKNEEVVFFHLCTPLKGKCHNDENYGVCLKTPTNETGLGKFPPELKFESYQISFKFTGDECNATANYTTIVILQCDYRAEGHNPDPTIIANVGCEYFIHWNTSLACGKQTRTNCSVTDESGYKYDLSELTQFNYNYQVPVNESLMILLNVCHSLIFGHGVSCSQNVGSCLIDSTQPGKNGENLGQISEENPTFLSVVKEGHLQLNYSDGDMCRIKGSTSLMNTIINFICDSSEEHSNPKYVNSNCTYNIEWRTPHACKNLPSEHIVVTRTQDSVKKPEIETAKNGVSTKSVGNNQVNCSITTEEGKFDLSPLILTKDAYVVKSNDSEFYINVCNPLSSKDNLNACQGKTVCKIHRDPSGRITSETSLGDPSENPIVLKDKHLVLHYKDGATCPENNKESISTVITFICKYDARKTSPQFDKYTNCTYLFKWETIHACQSAVGNFYENCTISDPLSRTINLSVLKHKTFRIYNGNKNYSISICGEKNLCNGSTICEGNNGLGSSINVIYEYPKDSVKLEFTKGTKCLEGTYESDITFVCNSSVIDESPTLISKSGSPCHVQFEWQTRLVCVPESDNSTSPKKPVPSNDNKDIDKKSEIAANNGTFLVCLITGVAIIVAIVMYLRDPSRRARCSRIVSSPCSSSSNDRVKYCRINTTEEARLLLDNCEPTTVCQSDSDDDLLGA